MNRDEALAYIAERSGCNLNAKSPIDLTWSRHGPLPALWAALGYTTGAEIGVEQGKFSKEICEGVPGVRLYSVDPWKTYSRYADHVSQSKLDRFYREAVARLAPYPNCEIIRHSSLEAVKRFKRDQLDFVYIDGNHEFEYVITDIMAWAKVVRSGGMVSGHDYRHEGKERIPIPFHVIQAVNAYVDAYKIKPLFILRGDKSASWMFIKP